MPSNLDKQHLAHTRRLVESRTFQQEFKALSDEYSILRDLLIAVRHDLAHYAHLEEDEYQGFYWKDTKPLFGTPTFSVMYRYDSTTVYLSSIVKPDEN